MMKKEAKTYSVIAALLLLASCNEEVNPLLKNASSTGNSDGGTTNPVNSKTFRVTLNNPFMLNQVLHRMDTVDLAGFGGFASNCSITEPDLTSNLYRGTVSDVVRPVPKYDITCIVDAEEVALYYNGVSFNVEASENACEYVSYSPYSYYKFQPGDSSRTVYKTTCNGVDNATLALAGQTRRECDKYYQAANENGSRGFVQTNPWTPISDASVDNDLCHFNYGGTNNCDIGTIKVITEAWTLDSNTNLPTKPPINPTSFISCGGRVSNCVAGPMRQMFPSEDVTDRGVIVRAEKNMPYSKEYAVKSPYEVSAAQSYMNVEVANFSRQCAGVNSEIGDTDVDKPIIGFDSIPMNNYYNPRILDLNAQNVRRNPADDSSLSPTKMNTYTTLANDPTLTSVPSMLPLRISSRNSTGQALAATPFSGLSPVNPYYSFYCLNSARDVKARIRIVVRDWDRTFPTDSPLMNLISDVHEGQDALIDNQYNETNNGDRFDSFNDIYDWDNILKFEDNDGIRASCEVPYPAGAWSQSSFPQNR